MQPDRKELDVEEIDLFEIWAKFKPVFARYKYWMLIAPVVFMFLGLGLSKIPAPQWEATVILQVGRVSPSEFIEPLDNLIWRLGTAGFKESALKKSGISLDSPEAALYQNSLNARPLKGSGMLEIKARGFSRESALKLASATAGEIRDIHASLTPQLLSGPKRRLAAIEKLNQDVAAAFKASKQLSAENRSLADIAAAYLASQTGQLKFALLDQIDFPELHPTALIDESAGNTPISPRKSLWIAYSLILGLFLGIVVPLALNSAGALNRPNKY